MDGSDPDFSAAFARALSDLRQQGSALLVVGHVPCDIHGKACSRMLGDPESGPRRRLFVATDRDPADFDDRIPDAAGIGADTTRILAPAVDGRSAAPHDPPAETAIPVTRLDDASLSALGRAITGAIMEFDDLADGLAPAELRLCFDSLSPLVDAYDRETVFRFLHPLTHLVRRKHGIAHFHLPVERDAELVRLLEPLFDAIVELRVPNGNPQQRWHLPGRDLASNWLDV